MRGRRSLHVQWVEVLEDGSAVVGRLTLEELPAPRVVAERDAAIEVAPTRPTVRKAAPVRLLGSRKAAA